MPLIVGGGPAGAAAAIELARGGIAATVIERSDSDQDVLCGGFLSWNTLRQLSELGIDPGALGGHPVDRLRLIAGKQAAAFALPAPGIGLSRRTLDAALLARAETLGVTVRRGTAVRSIEPDIVHLATDERIHADRIILATGKHDVRGLPRPATSDDPAMGLRWRFPASPALAARIAGAVELHLFDHGYAGLVMQEDGHANLCLAIRRSAFVAAGQRPEAVLAALIEHQPLLRERLGSERCGDAQAVANVPYGWHARHASQGLYRVGDQAGVIPSLAGEGVGIALASGMAAAQALLSDQPAEAFQVALGRHLRRPIGLARLLWHAAERPSLARIAVPVLAHIPAAARGAMRMTRIPTTKPSTNGPPAL